MSNTLTFVCQTTVLCSEFFLRVSLPSFLERVHELGDTSWNIVIHAQKYTQEQIDEIVSQFADRGLSEKLILTEAPLFSGHHKLDYHQKVIGSGRRIIPCDAYPKGDFYLYIEDDFLFKEGSMRKYKLGYDYLLENPDCGVIYYTGYMGVSKADGDLIRPYMKTQAWTGRGMLYRNFNRNQPREISERFQYYIHKSIPLTNMAVEDKAVIYAPMLEGFYIAKAAHCPTIHYSSGKAPKKYKSMLAYKEIRDMRGIPEEEYLQCNDHAWFDNVFDISGYMPRSHDGIGSLRFRGSFMDTFRKQNLAIRELYDLD